MGLKHLDLFSGIGGFALAARMVGGINTTQFVEIDPYAQKVLQKNFPGVPIHGDITTFTSELGAYDIITFGSPCQDFSSANPNGRGLEGKRSGLFFEAIRLLRVVRPGYAVFENVANVLTKDGGQHFEQILWAFSESGYDAEWQTISAASVGAPHLRERVFIVAYTNSKRSQGLWSEYRLYENCQERQIGGCHKNHEYINHWRTKPRVCGVDARVPRRVDRIRGLGNAVVPQVAAIALQRVLDIENDR